VFACTHDIFLSYLCWVCRWRNRHTQIIASATWVFYHSDELVSSRGIFLGSTTNNMAECHVVIVLLTEASSLGISRMIVNLESQLVVCQINRIYTIHNPILLHLHLRVHRLERMFDFIEYRHILRGFNTTLDSLANYIMDWYLAHR
jgi:ribonuclease HI